MGPRANKEARIWDKLFTPSNIVQTTVSDGHFHIKAQSEVVTRLFVIELNLKSVQNIYQYWLYFL